MNQFDHEHCYSYLNLTLIPIKIKQTEVDTYYLFYISRLRAIIIKSSPLFFHINSSIFKLRLPLYLMENLVLTFSYFLTIITSTNLWTGLFIGTISTYLGILKVKYLRFILCLLNLAICGPPHDKILV
jgi:hypothetical protein